ncbi:hypothetical protein KI387_020800, partial [Taxus chinensis]
VSYMVSPLWSLMMRYLCAQHTSWDEEEKGVIFCIRVFSDCDEASKEGEIGHDGILVGAPNYNSLIEGDLHGYTVSSTFPSHQSFNIKDVCIKSVWNECYSFDPGIITQLSLKSMMGGNQGVGLWCIKLANTNLYTADLEQQTCYTINQFLSLVIHVEKSFLHHKLFQQLLWETYQGKIPSFWPICSKDKSSSWKISNPFLLSIPKQFTITEMIADGFSVQYTKGCSQRHISIRSNK